MVGWKSQSYSVRSMGCYGKIANNLQVALKFETENMRQRGCAGETVLTDDRPTLTLKQRKEADNHDKTRY